MKIGSKNFRLICKLYAERRSPPEVSDQPF